MLDVPFIYTKTRYRHERVFKVDDFQDKIKTDDLSWICTYINTSTAADIMEDHLHYDIDDTVEIEFITNAIMDNIQSFGLFGFFKKVTKDEPKHTKGISKEAKPTKVISKDAHSAYGSLTTIEAYEKLLNAEMKTALKAKGDGKADMETIKEWKKEVRTSMKEFVECQKETMSVTLKRQIVAVEKLEKLLYAQLSNYTETIHRKAIEALIKKIALMKAPLRVALATAKEENRKRK